MLFLAHSSIRELSIWEGNMSLESSKYPLKSGLLNANKTSFKKYNALKYYQSELLEEKPIIL